MAEQIELSHSDALLDFGAVCGTQGGKSGRCRYDESSAKPQPTEGERIAAGLTHSRPWKTLFRLIGPGASN